VFDAARGHADLPREPGLSPGAAAPDAVLAARVAALEIAARPGPPADVLVAQAPTGRPRERVAEIAARPAAPATWRVRSRGG